jgi:hypothetical protein
MLMLWLDCAHDDDDDDDEQRQAARASVQYAVRQTATADIHHIHLVVTWFSKTLTFSKRRNQHSACHLAQATNTFNMDVSIETRKATT